MASRRRRTGSEPEPEPESALPAAGLLRLTERLDVLLFLEQDAEERKLAHEPLAPDARALEHGDPLDELARRRTLSQARDGAKRVEGDDRLIDEVLIDLRMVHAHDPLHELLVWKIDEVKHAAAKERVGQFLLVVRGDDHDGTLGRDDLVVG